MERDADFSIDMITPSETTGWAWLPSEPSLILSIEIMSENGKLISRTFADKYRKDLYLAGKRNGWCGFAFSFENNFHDGPLYIQARIGSRTFPMGGPFQTNISKDGIQHSRNISLRRAPATGHCDGVRGRHIFGWAWRPDTPDEVVEVELYINGVLFMSTSANEYRADLRIAGIGHGRYGWRMRFPKIRDGRPVDVIVRERGGPPIQKGVFSHPKQLSGADLEDPEIRLFIDSALNTTPQSANLPSNDNVVNTNFLIFSPDAANPASAERVDNYFSSTHESFIPLLSSIGRVHRISDPLDWRIDILVEEALRRGETSVLLSFAPPSGTPLVTYCPVIPVISWPFPTIPDKQKDGDSRHDWHFMLRHTGRAIACSKYAADAVRSGIGTEFPINIVPIPTWNRNQKSEFKKPQKSENHIYCNGLIFDTQGFSAGSVDDLPSLPLNPEKDSLSSHAVINGIIFTSIISPQDDQKEWVDTLVAFLAALGERPDVTLVFNMLGDRTDRWWWDFHETLARQRNFSCRVIVIQGNLDIDSYNSLIEATHWIVHHSTAAPYSLALQYFMCAGRPAISSKHTAMSDYLNTSNALVVESSEDFGTMFGGNEEDFAAVHHRSNWRSFRDAFSSAYLESAENSAKYSERCAAARETMRLYCSDEVVTAKLDSFLGLGLGTRAMPSPSRLAEVGIA